jgi:hypothetical protein
MNLSILIKDRTIRAAVILLIAAAIFFACPGNLFASEAQDQKVFNTPEEAVQALISACQNDDTNALLQVFGKEAKGVVDTPDKEAAKKRRAEFCVLAGEQTKIEKDGEKKAILIVGNNNWPFPVPLVKEDAGWRFDSAAGRNEILFRLIGENEITAIEVCLEYPIVQREYAAQDRNGNGVAEYARKFRSTPGKMDGLYWASAPGKEESPAGKFLAQAGVNHADKKGKSTPFSGYYFKILTGQGANAPGGKFDYIINGHMVAGFALIAYPAEYGTTGIKTFMVNSSGIVYESDLGENTSEIAGKITEFNPDKNWTPLNK